MKKTVIAWTMMLLCSFSFNSYGQETPDNGKDLMSSGLLNQWSLWVRSKTGATGLRQLFAERTKTFGDVTYHEVKGASVGAVYCRQADNRLYRYSESDGTEYVLFDFGLKKGDSFQMPDGRTMRVEEVTDTTYTDGWEDLGLQPLRLLKLVNVENGEDRDVWIEGVGSVFTSVLTKDELGTDIRESRLLWTEEIPVINSFNTEHLKSLLVDMERVDDADAFTREDDRLVPLSDSLNCRFEADTLVISGRIFTGCALRHYLWCDIHDNKISLNIDGIVNATCVGVYKFTARIPGFSDGSYTLRYAGWGGSSIEKNLVCGTPRQVDYRPFVEDGKTWVVGTFPAGGTSATAIKRYYFEGDTVVGGQTCKRWMRDGELVFPVYEEGRRVWFFPEGETEPRLLYDFAASVGETAEVTLAEKSVKTACEILGEGTDSNVGGTLRYLSLCDAIGMTGYDESGMEGIDKEQWKQMVSYRWYEGIGTLLRPTQNAGIGGGYGNNDILVQVSVGDVIIYQDSSRTLTDVRSVAAPADKKSALFDLSGRPLASPPSKGIYIQNGKKVIK